MRRDEIRRDVIGKCPVCSQETSITRIKCDSCGTVIEGQFLPCKFCRLSPEQKAFIDVFIKRRGNIKEVEKELGVSYPTVKNKLEDAAGALGYREESEPVSPGRKKEVLEKLSKGEISTEEAINLLKE